MYVKIKDQIVFLCTYTVHHFTNSEIPAFNKKTANLNDQYEGQSRLRYLVLKLDIHKELCDFLTATLALFGSRLTNWVSKVFNKILYIMH